MSYFDPEAILEALDGYEIDFYNFGFSKHFHEPVNYERAQHYAHILVQELQKNIKTTHRGITIITLQELLQTQSIRGPITHDVICEPAVTAHNGRIVLPTYKKNGKVYQPEVIYAHRKGVITGKDIDNLLDNINPQEHM
ncbi:MAG: hypothetical protein Q7R56_02455 [Nanoarchaeota archaeon]|nr:hypothetical protein [Nanoarchaeota archaeon]